MNQMEKDAMQTVINQVIGLIQIVEKLKERVQQLEDTVYPDER